ncbi:DUF2190 family protein [Leisingera sp.]|uniref:DUF2190 family protein n=1 Tax=Leisingera sp. TaxID=1879318 RepID=UPI002B269D8A|nr:DUF2190 family protein [Leisingera sp.]
MKNFKSQGNTLTFTAAADYSSGDGVLLDTLFGVAAGDIASGEEGVLNLQGVYELPKVGSQAWTVGAAVYWDDANSRCTTVAEDAALIGCAVAPVGSGAEDTLGVVRLNGIAGLGAVVPVTNAV